MSDLQRLLSIDSEMAEKLQEAGYSNPTAVVIASPAAVASTANISNEQAKKLQKQAYERVELEGFQKASEVEEPPDLGEYDVPEEVDGWTLIGQSNNRLVWSTPSEYRVTVGGLGLEVGGSLPPEGDIHDDYNPQKTKVQKRSLKSNFDQPVEAIGYAVGWMEANPIIFEEDLTEFVGISERTAEYLRLKHDIHNHQRLYELYQMGVLADIIGPQFLDELRAEMDDIFGGKF